MEKLIKLLDSNPALSLEEIAVMLGTNTKKAAEMLDKLHSDGVYMGVKSVINWDNVEFGNHVCAYIDVKVQPKLGKGFDEVAHKMSLIDEVESVYLMSGGYDLGIKMRGKSFQDIAIFVATRLSAIESVISTTTHFVLKRYKEDGVIMAREDKDDRSTYSL